MWANVLVKGFGIKAKIRGSDNLPDYGVVFVFNHTSLLDIPVLFSFIKKPFRFGAKEELFKIPVFGYSMKKIGMLPIFRSNKKKTLGMYKEIILSFKHAKSYMLAPEGTRSSDGKLKQFKSGPFILAIDAKAPIVPVVIRGTDKILAKGKVFANLKNTLVEIDILPAVSTDEYSIDERVELREKVRGLFLKSI